MTSYIRLEKDCIYCGKAFTAKTTVTKYCGDDCAKRAYKKRVRDRKIESVKIKEPVSKQLIDLKEKDYLSVNEIVQLIGISRRTIYRMIERKELRFGKAGRRTIIKRTDVESAIFLNNIKSSKDGD